MAEQFGKVDPLEFQVAILKTKAAIKTYNDGNIRYELRGDKDEAEKAYTELRAGDQTEIVLHEGFPSVKIGIATKIVK